MSLFAFGSNGSGQLGIGHVDDVSIPTECLFEEYAPSGPASTSTPPVSSDESRVPNNSEILRIVAGGNHTLLLLAGGAVYAAGCNEDGRCGGQGSSSDSLCRFRRVVVGDESGRTYDTFEDVSATWEGTFLVAVSSSGDVDGGEAVFVLGSGAKAELGLGSGCVQATTPVKIPDFPPPGTKVVSIASGMGHTVAVLSSGEVYGWGGARKGQLGDSATAHKFVWAPLRVEGIPFYVTGAACGREFTVVTGDKDAGEFAVLGSSNDKWKILSGVPAPGVLAGYLSVSASWHGVYVHQGDSSVVSWGRDDRGQLPPADMPVVRKIAVGSEHALALLDGRTVVAFGWGEHGNCGPATDAQGNVKGKYSQIPLSLGEGSEVVGIGAGCATSWIIAS